MGGDEEDEDNEDEEDEEGEKKIIVELDIIVCTAGFRRLNSSLWYCERTSADEGAGETGRREAVYI